MCALSAAWPVRVHLSAEICNVSGGKQVIDVDQELLFDNLVVSHQEGDGNALHTSLQATPCFSSEAAAGGSRAALTNSCPDCIDDISKQHHCRVTY